MRALRHAKVLKTINSTAFVAEAYMHNRETPLRVVVDAPEGIPTNVDSIITLITKQHGNFDNGQAWTLEMVHDHPFRDHRNIRLPEPTVDDDGNTSRGFVDGRRVIITDSTL